MAMHSALLTGVFELVIIIVLGVGFCSIFKIGDTATEPRDKEAPRESYLERDRAYLDEQADAYQQERESRHQV